MKKIVISISAFILGLVFSVTPALAHVVVKPNQVGVGAFQTFTMGVPNEKDNATVSLRLVIPEGLNYVSPNVKPGWTIEVKKTGEGEDAKVTEVDWTGGSIPVGQRDDFYFSAQVPAQETTVNWKAYQTYEDGTVVSWDQNPDSMKNLSDVQKEENEKKGLGPYSQTKVMNDLTSQASMKEASSDKSDNAFLLSVVAIALSAAALAMQLVKRK